MRKKNPLQLSAMCGRFNVTTDPLTDLLMDLVGQKYDVADNFNTSPTQTSWIVRELTEDEQLHPETAHSRIATDARWWLVPSWAKEKQSKYSMFNARCENLEKSAAFRGPFKYRRCAVPITGYYEWLNVDGTKQPHYIASADQSGLMLAGLWDRWIDFQTGEILDSFTIVTNPSAESMRFLHHRQPVMLSREDARTWIDSRTEIGWLKSKFASTIPQKLEITPVSTYVSNSRNQGSQCVEGIDEPILVAAT